MFKTKKNKNKNENLIKILNFINNKNISNNSLLMAKHSQKLMILKMVNYLHFWNKCHLKSSSDFIWKLLNPKKDGLNLVLSITKYGNKIN